MYIQLNLKCGDGYIFFDLESQNFDSKCPHCTTFLPLVKLLPKRNDFEKAILLLRLDVSLVLLKQKCLQTSWTILPKSSLLVLNTYNLTQSKVMYCVSHA